jgi:prepilin-type N-terminal cleavage/methylation domain-containing protein
MGVESRNPGEANNLEAVGRELSFEGKKAPLGMTMAKINRRGFSLTEMLVVIGIIVVLVALVIPAVMRARRQGRLTTCMGNMRQIGAMYLLYAERNDDYIPLGTSRFKDPNHPGVTYYTPMRPPPHNTPWPWPGYHTQNNQYLWVEGAPSAAMGPLLLAKLITPDNAKILYCPSEEILFFRWEYNRDRYTQAMEGKDVSIIVGYAVRPIKRLWTHDHEKNTVEYPPLMPKLMRNDRLCIVAEHPQFQPYNHGSEKEPLLNALYGDGSVRTVFGKQFRPTYELYATIDGATGYPSGYLTASNNYALRDDTVTSDIPGDTIWSTIDKN